MGPDLGENTGVALRPERLAREDRLLVELRDWLYEGSWQEMLEDLAARLAGRPYLFDLQSDAPGRAASRQRVGRDIDAIHRLVAQERRDGINLSDYPDADG